MTLTASLHSKNTPKGKQFYIRWREAGRQRHETIKGVYGKDALRIAAERKREIEQGRWYIAPPERLGAFLEGWLERQANHVKPQTLQRKRESLRALGVLSEGESRHFTSSAVGMRPDIQRRPSRASLSENTRMHS